MRLREQPGVWDPDTITGRDGHGIDPYVTLGGRPPRSDLSPRRRGPVRAVPAPRCTAPR
jgi:hypothetical protein